ncbi:MAG: monofunctional biosynthetic peptidoglycan transglycosylase, partial [Woeseia sp.]
HTLRSILEMPRKRKVRSRLTRWPRYIALAVLSVVLVTVALVLPLRWFAPATSSFMLQDKSGRVPVAYQWTNREQLGNTLPLAVVAAEDQKFTRHTGFDLASIRDSVADYKDGDGLRGASTITQQLAKNLYLWPGRNFVRKGLEAWLTVFIEVCLPKRRILEIYLNIIELAPGTYGAAAASQHFFGKPPAALSDAEAALLAAVLPNPKRLNAGRPSAYVRERASWIRTQMARLRREGWLQSLE